MLALIFMPYKRVGNLHRIENLVKFAPQMRCESQKRL